jgi:hypothetical protein
MIRRRILIAVLGLGTVLGYAGGFASMRACGHHRREAFEQRVARVCVEAARNAPPPRPADQDPSW